MAVDAFKWFYWDTAKPVPTMEEMLLAKQQQHQSNTQSDTTQSESNNSKKKNKGKKSTTDSTREDPRKNTEMDECFLRMANCYVDMLECSNGWKDKDTFLYHYPQILSHTICTMFQQIYPLQQERFQSEEFESDLFKKVTIWFFGMIYSNSSESYIFLMFA